MMLFKEWIPIYIIELLAEFMQNCHELRKNEG